MNSFRSSSDSWWNALLGLSLVAIVISSWCALARPSSAASVPIGVPADLKRMNQTIGKANDAAVAAMKDVTPRLWTVDNQVLSSSVLADLSQMVDKSHVQLGGFRSERLVTVAHLEEAPFVAVVEGSFPDVMALIGELENPDSKLAVNLVQISSADTGGGNVTATIGLVAFLPEEKK